MTIADWRWKGAGGLLMLTTMIFYPVIAFGQQASLLCPISLLNHQAAFTGNDTTMSFSIPQGFLIKDSCVVFINDSLIDDDGYRVDYAGKRVIFNKAPERDSRVVIRYQALPFRLVRRRTAIAQAHNDTGKAVNEKIIRLNTPLRDDPAEDEQPSLIKRGSFTRSVQIGSGRGLSMFSGLRMELRGKVSRDLDVVASLTDQNTPLQPEGNTQTLQEIDKLFFQVRGKRFETTLGDYTLEYSGTSFGRYRRKLQGMMGKASTMGQEVTVSAAMSRGQFTTKRFMGREGNQGPYQLTGNQGERDIIVIAGTEKVWIDGEPMRRGEDGDYVIEYSTGEITFTRHRLITDASRIEVDYQYSNGRYKRGFYSMHSEGSTEGDKFSYRASFFREADNADSPFQFSLSDDNLQTFQQYQSNRDIAPESQSLGDVEFQFRPKEYINLRTEIAMSRFSNGGGQTASQFKGSAWDVGFAITPEKLHFNNTSLGRGSIAARWRNVAEDFRSMTRIRGVEYTRKWDIREGELGGEQTLEVNGVYMPVSFLNMEGEVGTLAKGDHDRSRRMSFRGGINKESLPRLWYQLEHIRRSFASDADDGKWLRQLGKVSYTRFGITPELTFESEKKKNKELHPGLRGFQFHDIGAQVRFERGRKITGRLGYRVRDEKDQLEEFYTHRGQAVTRNFAFTYKPRSSFRNTFEIISRKKHFETGADDITTNLVDYNGAFIQRRRGVQVQAHYQMSREQLPLKEKVYLEVEEGRGSYRYDKEHDEYVPVERGDYLLRYLLTDTYSGVRGMKMGTTVDIRWGRLFPMKKNTSSLVKFWQGIRTRSIFRVDYKGKLDDINGSGFSFSGGGIDTSAYFGNTSYLQEVFLFENTSDLSVRLRFNFRNVLNNQYLNEGERRRSGDHSVRVRWNLNKKWGIQMDLAAKNLLRLYQTNSFLERDIHSRRMDTDIFYRPTQRTEYSLQTHLGREENRSAFDGTKISIFGLTPGFRYSITRKGRLQGNIDWYNVGANTPIRILPFEMANGKNVGNSFEWRVNFEYQIASHIASNIEYRGEKGRWGLLHLGRAEVRAFF